MNTHCLFDDMQSDLIRDTDRLIARFGLQPLVLGQPATPVQPRVLSRWVGRIKGHCAGFVSPAHARLSEAAYRYIPLLRAARLIRADRLAGASTIAFIFEAATCALTFLVIDGLYRFTATRERRAGHALPD